MGMLIYGDTHIWGRGSLQQWGRSYMGTLIYGDAHIWGRGSLQQWGRSHIMGTGITPTMWTLTYGDGDHSNNGDAHIWGRGSLQQWGRSQMGTGITPTMIFHDEFP